MIDEASKSKLRRLMELKQQKEVTALAAKQAKEAYQDAEAEMFDEFNERGVVGTIKMDLGPPWGTVAFRTRETYYGQIIDEDEALRYFEQRAMVDEISTPKFVDKRINEIVRDCIEQQIDTPPGISYYARRGMTVSSK